MSASSSRIVVMTAGGLNPQVMINALARHFDDLHVIQEDNESKLSILRRRARRFGWVGSLGQLATMLASRLGKKAAARRSAQILDAYGLTATPPQSQILYRVTSLNSPECHEQVTRLAPSVVFTISCRILSRETLAAIPCPVINFHAGINPAYRGQMGGYWARIAGDDDNFGATVHMVDAGVDTGATLYESRVQPSAADWIATYPLLLTAASTDAAARAVRDAISGTLCPIRPKGPSTLRFPPPIWTWLYHGVTKGIW